ncbi:MAG: hypothetical protein MUE73_07965 [Planctomycetes bacterium]|jgi:hypothetical protein|nr:hypothetical protein [Planctomycetota bacterium]
MTRQLIIIVVLVSAVAGVLAAFGTASALRRDPAASAPGTVGALEEEVRELRQRLAAIEEGKLDRAAFDNGLASIAERLSTIEKAIRAPAGETAEKPATSPPLPTALGAALAGGGQEDAMRAVGELMKVQLKQGRDRFVSDLLNPSEASRARQQREVKRWAQMLAGNLGLDETERSAVEQVLAEVDQGRRDRLRQVFESKPVDQITYGADLKPVIDDSFSDEDRRISQILPPEKADQYKQNADVIRGFITTMASAAFPDQK